MNPQSDLALLPWDSEFFGLRIARYAPSRLRSEDLPTLDAWTSANAVDCLYFLAEPDCAETLTAAHEGGFKFIDMRVQYELPANRMTGLSSPPVTLIRAADLSDKARVFEIAQRAHTNTRFFKDSNFPRDRSTQMYVEWLRVAFRDHRKAVFVAIHGADEVVGYVSCELSGTTGQIGLIGVDEPFQGRGFASQLLTRAILWCGESGATEMRLITQASNPAAANLYVSAGFVQTSLRLWFHRWRTAGGAPFARRP